MGKLSLALAVARLALGDISAANDVALSFTQEALQLTSNGLQGMSAVLDYREEQQRRLSAHAPQLTAVRSAMTTATPVPSPRTLELTTVIHGKSEMYESARQEKVAQAARRDRQFLVLPFDRTASVWPYKFVMGEWYDSVPPALVGAAPGVAFRNSATLGSRIIKAS